MAPEGAGGHQPATVQPAPNRARVRDAVLAGHRGDVEAARELARDEDGAVRMAALGALHRLGRLGVDDLGTALGDPRPAVRRRACVLAGRTLAAGAGDDGSPVPPAAADAGPLVDLLVEVLTSEDDAWTVEAAAWALGEAGASCGRGAVDALERVARGHADPLCREAAVAALGAVGDEGSLDTVLRALDDKPAVRRRAAVALAAFDGPAVESALRRCLDDRDWQVRQVAEDLLAVE